jgi:hypothetical protein
MDPAMQMPNMSAGLPPEFGDPSTLPHDSKRPDIIACVVVTWFIGAAFVASRFYTKIAINRSKIGWSEWTILLACVGSLLVEEVRRRARACG